MTTDPLLIQPSWLDAQRPRQGRYVLGPLLGKGGMGEVVEAWDVVLCRTVALKILSNMEPTALIRFMHEAQIQARVVHPHICRIYDVESSEGTVKIAMQLIRGSTLEHAARGLSMDQVVTLMAQVAEAVHAAHRLNLIHRDLKPSNILLEKDANDQLQPYLCDFGLAMAMNEPPLTATNGVIGTPAFMAPEQFRGDRTHIGPATDIYGLGGTLYFALRGEALAGPIPDTGSLPQGMTAGIPSELWKVIRKCLQQEPELRYLSAAALAEDLWRFLNREPIQATTPGVLGRFRRRHRRGLRLGAGLAALAASLALTALAEGAYLNRIQTGRAERARLFSREAGDLETGLRLERMLPVHDLRPEFNRIRARMEEQRLHLAGLDEAAAAPGHWALARIHLEMGDCQEAAAEALLARAGGFSGPETQDVLARALARGRLEQGVPDSPEPTLAAQVESLFRQAQGPDPVPDPLSTGLVAWLRGEYRQAAQAASAALAVRPWDADGAVLGAFSLLGLARERLETGDGSGAEALSREAMGTAQRFLEVTRSDERVHHAYLVSARFLASLLQDRGALPPAFLQDLDQRCEQALRLDPGQPALQNDWLGMRFLEVSDKLEGGRDPDRELTGALVFLGTQLREPLPPALRSTRMLIYWRAAEWDLRQGRNPGPALAEAVKDLDRGPLLRVDYPARMLVFKARVEAGAGRDPRPAADEALAFVAPQLKAQAFWRLQLAGAEAWLLKARWEAGHGLDAAASLAHAADLAQQALAANPASPEAHALTGLAQVVGIQAAPGKAHLLRAVAQEQLAAALALSPQGRLQGELARALGSPAPRAKAAL